MSRRGNLSQALSQFDKRAEVSEKPPETPQKEAAASAPLPAPLPPRGQGRVPVPPSRQGKKALTGYFDPEVLKQLKVMAASEDTTVQALLTEALNDLFKKHGKPHIA